MHILIKKDKIMGQSVLNQVDTSKYFSLSTIDKRIFVEKGINISLTDFKEIVRRSPPFIQIITGSQIGRKKQRLTNIYRYDDFINK